MGLVEALPKCRVQMAQWELAFMGPDHVPWGRVLHHSWLSRTTVSRMGYMGQHRVRESLRVWVCPGGTWNNNGDLPPFKKGVLHLAMQSRCPSSLWCISSSTARDDTVYFRNSPGRGAVYCPQQGPHRGWHAQAHGHWPPGHEGHLLSHVWDAPGRLGHCRPGAQPGPGPGPGPVAGQDLASEWTEGPHCFTCQMPNVTVSYSWSPPTPSFYSGPLLSLAWGLGPWHPLKGESARLSSVSQGRCKPNLMPSGPRVGAACGAPDGLGPRKNGQRSGLLPSCPRPMGCTGRL